MDIKTIQKVINGQEDKLQELEQKANRTGQFHLDSINEKFAKLEKKINDNKDNCVSNNDYKKLWEENTKDYNVLARKRLDDYTKGIKNSEKIEALEDRVEFNINDRITTLEKKADNMLMLEQDINRKIFARMDSIDSRIGEHYDILESKYYKLRSELDAVYKVLELDALDIQDLYNKLENHPNKKNALEQDFEELVKEGDKNAK